MRTIDRDTLTLKDLTDLILEFEDKRIFYPLSNPRFPELEGVDSNKDGIIDRLIRYDNIESAQEYAYDVRENSSTFREVQAEYSAKLARGEITRVQLSPASC